VNPARAPAVVLLLIAVSFGQTSTGQFAPPKDTTQRTPLPSASSAVGRDTLTPEVDARYSMGVSVDEVRLTFHAIDQSGRPVEDLKLSDLDLFDNQAGPGTIVALRKMKGLSLRVGFLVDVSGSVSDDVGRSRMIAIAAAQALMQNEIDQGLVIEFRRARNIRRPWSRDLNAVTDGLRTIGLRPDGSLDGTSLFDSLWSTCYYDFRGEQERAENILLLLSDGVDTSSHGTLEQAVGACQQAHTSIFVLTSTSDLSDLSMGHRTLRKLTEQTGGSIIVCGGSEAEVRQAMNSLAADVRSEYLLFYRPKNLKRDGSFHRIVLVGPPRVADIVGQSGYYALPR